MSPSKVVIRSAFFGEVEKIAWDWHKFREGLTDEGIPLGGATIGAALGARHGAGLRGAALGYAAGGAASIGRSYLKGEKPSTTRKLLAGGALGYGAGGLLHGQLAGATKGATKGLLAKMKPAFHAEKTFKHGLVEEGLPALGATLGTATAMGMDGKKKVKQKTAGVRFNEALIAAFVDELEKIGMPLPSPFPALTAAGAQTGRAATMLAKKTAPVVVPAAAKAAPAVAKAAPGVPAQHAAAHDLLAKIRAAKASGAPTTITGPRT